MGHYEIKIPMTANLKHPTDPRFDVFWQQDGGLRVTSRETNGSFQILKQRFVHPPITNPKK